MYLPSGTKQRLTLYETGQNLTPRLQKGMPSNDLKKPLQPLPPMLNNIIRKPIGKHLPWQRRDRDSCAFPLENVAEVLEVRVPTAHDGVFQFERGDVGAADYFIRRVHVSRCAVGLGVADLESWLGGCYGFVVRGGEVVVGWTEVRLTSISRKFSGGP